MLWKEHYPDEPFFLETAAPPTMTTTTEQQNTPNATMTQPKDIVVGEHSYERIGDLDLVAWAR